MEKTPKPVSVWVDRGKLWVDLDDGRTIGAPMIWFPKLSSGGWEQWRQYKLSDSAIHWDELDENISVVELLSGEGDQNGRQKRGPMTISEAALKEL